MLIYEIFLRNKNSNERIGDRLYPIKKIMPLLG